MADSRVRIIIDVDYDGREVRVAQRDIDKLDDSTQSAAKSADNWKAALGFTTAALGAMALGARELYQAVNEGAEIARTEEKFWNLAESIGANNNLLDEMRAATSGMVSDAELMRGGVDLMNIGIADSQEEMARWTSVIGDLDLDMQQVTLTIANMSTMRLDALGLSVDEVNTKFEAYQETMSDEDAWNLAVLESLEEKTLLLGSAADTTAGQLAIMQASWANVTDGFKVGTAEGVAPLIANINELLGVLGIDGGLAEISQMAGEAFTRGLLGPIGVLHEQTLPALIGAVTTTKSNLQEWSAVIEHNGQVISGWVNSGINVATGAINSLVGAINSAISRAHALASVLPGIDGPGSSQFGQGSRGPQGNASGTSFFPGGLTNIHERGPELVSLPRGVQINNAPKTRAMGMKGQMGGGDTHYHLHAGGSGTSGLQNEFAMLQALAGAE